MADELMVEMLPARHGDGLWIEWGEPDDRHRMIIDGGTKKAVAHLVERFDELDKDKRHVDLLVISHIDLDHIEAPIELLRTPVEGATFGDVWFNDYHHLAGHPGTADSSREEADGTRGGIQGEFLGALLHHRKLPWNQAFKGGPVALKPSGVLPRVSLAGGLDLVLLSPTASKLGALEPVWKKAISEVDLSPGERARALQLLEGRMGEIAPTRGHVKKWGHDGSEANGSSIAFIAEYGDERWLFAADAHDDLLRSSLKRYAKEEGEERVRLDGFKIPHHGSISNMSEKLLDLIDCERFLISSNGAYFKHPDKDCIDLIVEKTTNPELRFNYLTEFTKPWKRKNGVTASYEFDRSHKPLSDRADAVTNGDGEPRSSVDAPVAETQVTTGLDRDARPATELHVEVIHGSIDRADSPVIIGHYDGTPLAGAEGFIDRRFKGRLTDRHILDEYPGPLGSYLHVLPPARSQPAGGVLIIGLGEYGNLTPLRLAEGVRSALVSHALDQADKPKKPRKLAISSVLIGATGDQGLGVRTAVRAIVKGVDEANHSLTDDQGEARCQYTALTLWERQAGAAELALHALGPTSEADDEPDERNPDALPSSVKVTAALGTADGALLHGIPQDLDQRPWRRIAVHGVEGQADDDPLLHLEFSIDGRLAGVGKGSHQVERERLDRILDRASRQSRSQTALYTTLFEQLLPNEIKADLVAAADIQFEVDEHSAVIPWEMLEARNPRRKTREALALRAPFTRQLATPLIGTVVRASEPTALVIGNPPAGPAWPSLPGAFHEAVAVSAVLEQGRQRVTSKHFDPGDTSDDRSTDEIEAVLCSDAFRIIHIAGHGSYDPEDATKTGVVIGESAFITARFLSQLQAVPDLVFLNCCHLGQLEETDEKTNRAAGDFHRLGSSLARQLIESGVRAVVAAGWAVDDRAATNFAATFYEQLTRVGATFGEAVFAARQAAYATAPDSSTWGAYQCYGDSGLRLAIGRVRRPPRPPSTVRETLRRIELLIDQVESVGVANETGSGLDWATQELIVLSSTTQSEGWLEHDDGGMLAEQLARANAELRNFAKAIEWYDVAFMHAKATASLGAIEQRANLRDRYAADLMSKPQRTAKDKKLALTLAAAAEDDMVGLVALGGSSERFGLLAGHYKRQATIHSGKRRTEALGKSIRWYHSAYVREVEQEGADAEGYQLFNAIQLDEIRTRINRRLARKVPVESRDALKPLIRRLDRLPPSDQSYWSAVGRGEGRLTVALMEGDLERQVKRITRYYVEALERRCTARERASSIDHLEDLIELHPDEAQSAALAAIRAGINEEVADNDSK